MSIMRPMPEPDAASAPFFEALNQCRLLLQRCGSCGTCQLGEHRCNSCGSKDIGWAEASGRASLYSFTIVHVPYHPAFASQVPYNAAMVELEEGPRLFSNIVGCTHDELRIGLALAVDFEQHGDGWLPVFRPRRSDSD
jgi:uncharacterized OB-fold protein